jgi:YidC/Oxa1 family membrane protein insertase
MPDNTNRNTILFVILSMALLFGYQALVLGPQNKQREAELKARETAQATQPEVDRHFRIAADSGGHPRP